QGPAGVDQPGFAALVSLVQSGKAYVKLSGAYRGSTQAPTYPDMAPLAKALVAANPQRILWGSDWPHPNTSPDARNAETGTSPRIDVDDAALLNQLAGWIPTAPQRRVALVENPARLYGWEFRRKGGRVALNEELVGCVREGLKRGVAREEIAGALQSAGWPADQVSRAMAAYADIPFAIPVPRPVTTGSMRDAFMYILMSVTLLICAWNFGSILFEFIDHAFPDPALTRSYYSYRSTAEAIRWDLSALIVSFPLFLVIAWRVARITKIDPTRRAAKTRRVVTYGMLFIASLTLIGDVTS